MKEMKGSIQERNGGFPAGANIFPVEGFEF
jgi:hypothetical protein